MITEAEKREILIRDIVAEICYTRPTKRFDKFEWLVFDHGLTNPEMWMVVRNVFECTR